jgi:hypothetical protein
LGIPGRSTRAETRGGLSTSEIRCYAAIALTLAALDVAASVIDLTASQRSSDPGALFGFSQLRWWGVLAAAVAVGLAVRARRLPVAAMSRLDTVWMRMAFAAACGIAFFMLRSWFINPDGALFPMKFMVDVPAKGFHATHDEMWELYIHSKFWLYTNDRFGWSVAASYQVLSCAAGAVFVFLMLAWCRRLVPAHRPLAFVACVSGGYMQLFFGDVENYTLMTTLVMGYFVASASALDRRTSILYPALLLATALTFHLEAGFLLPSLVYLLFVASRRQPGSHIVAALIGFVVVVAGTLVFFHLAGLHINDLIAHSQAFGDSGPFRQMLATPSLDYYFQIANLAFLLAPFWVILFALVLYRRIPLDAVNVHLIVAAAGVTALVIGWKAQLGVYNDWNLFAMAAVPIALLVWRNVFRVVGAGPVPWPIVAMIAVFFAHSYSWVIGNHWS